MLSTKQKSSYNQSTILKVLGMTQPGIEPTTTRSPNKRSTSWATVSIQANNVDQD